ncbi:MAG: NUDIX domain-containing protein [Clostridiales bacterium]|nr:NUDIX domain-containing protein [Clostridiales bacterium]
MAGYMVYNPCINEYTAKGDLQMSYISDLRELIGHRPIMAAAAVCILYDKDKGLLFEKRTDTGEWCVPGGALELGEEPEEGLLREVKEETNLDITEYEFFKVKANVHLVYPNTDEVYYTDFVYIATGYSGELRHDGESVDLKWFGIDSLPDNIMPTQTEYIEEFIKIIRAGEAYE